MAQRSKHLFKSIGLFFGLLLLAGITITSYASSNSDATSTIFQLSPNGFSGPNAVAFSPGGKLIAVGSSLGIHFLDAQIQEELHLIATQSWVRSVAFSPDGALLASGSYDPIVRVWRVSDAEILHELQGHTAWVRSVAFSPDGKLLASASDDNSVRLWRIADGSEALVIREGMEGVRTVTFSPDGTILATGGSDNIIRLWRVGDGKLLRQLSGHKAWVRTLAFSPDGDLLASGGFDTSVRIWRVEDGTLLATRDEHASSVLGLAFSPDGSLLASASVDKAVRLWSMPDGEPYSQLLGHTDFVYSVAFSPDSRELLSGSSDNTLRLWKIPDEAADPPPEIVQSPSDCRVCHHPQSAARPPRVIETNCVLCHEDGVLASNWCPIFPRTSDPAPFFVSTPGKDKVGYVMQNQPQLGVVFTTPGNGEHFYARGETLETTLIAGKVYYAGGSAGEINIVLEVWQASELISSMSTYASKNGLFSFVVNLVGNGDAPYADTQDNPLCLDCHFLASNTLPAGEVNLRVVATAPDGTQSSDQRTVRIDQSGKAIIAVHVQLENGQALPDIAVQADTALYNWRDRNFSAFTDTVGKAKLQVESLNQIPTTYQVSVPPTVLDGILYESIEAVEVTLPPGAISSPLVTLQLRSRSGAISGSMPHVDSPLSIWAIHLPEGGVEQAQLSPQGEFAFPNLPIGSYLLTSDAQVLAAQGLVLEAQSVELTQSPSATVNLATQTLEGASLHGRVLDEDGNPLPFALLSMGEQLQASQPMGGSFALHGLTDEASTLIVSAPGYYSQARVADAAPLDFHLVRREETLLLPWGEGEIILPPETIARLVGEAIVFEQGWLWGEVGESLVIELEEGFIEIQEGQFALERLPGKAAWFYLFTGQAQVQAVHTELSVAMGSAQMLRLELGEEILPVAYDSVVVQALLGGIDKPISIQWQSSLNAQIRDQIASLGINTAQIVTFVTYSVALIALLGAPMLAIYWKLRRH